MGDGLKRVAKQCGGLTAKSGGKTVQFDGDGNAVNPQFIYAIDEHYGDREPTITSAEILKETEKQVIIKDAGLAFGCVQKRNKSDYPVYRTPDDAIDGYIETIGEEIGRLLAKTRELREKIKRAEALREGSQS